MFLPLNPEEKEDIGRELIFRRGEETTVSPGIFQGMGHEIYNIVPRSIDKLTSPFTANDSDTHRTDPHGVGLVGSFIEQMSDFAPYLAVAKGGKFLLGALPSPHTKALSVALEAIGIGYAFFSKQSETRKEFMRQGVDEETANKLGFTEATIGIPTMFLPPALPLKSAPSKIASGVMLSIGAGGVDRKMHSSILYNAGYKEMSEFYKVFDGHAMILDGAMGAFATVMGHQPSRRYVGEKAGEGLKTISTKARESMSILDDLADYIMESKLYRYFHQDSQIGIPTKTKAYSDHIDIMQESVDSIIKGKPLEFDSDKLSTIHENSLDNPNRSKLELDLEPSPTRKIKEAESGLVDKPIAETVEKKPTQIETSGTAPEPLNEFSYFDEKSAYEFKKLEESSPELADHVVKTLKEDMEFTKLAKEKNLYDVAIECFLSTGSVE
ncbi:MAG: hypothetical protein C4617_04705 [Candidatus Liberibacter europaeus]|uniref:Uncharacterized protein n=1 Tax=Candidatus Liberibacter europaeus TaxID=744859 RepID=A0A2T4VWN3_9HYPH|nr:hypothetical protein [Candidatus Liberibacter europaeus]PTL86176.1 MAG: hypothetical protein C4617_04705 [Candidatus Liberibacter europaeus]